MGKYDAALKFVLQRWTSALVRELTGEALARWRNIEFPKVSTQYADLLVETVSGNLWHLELQSSNDPAMALRMLEYSVRVYRAYGRFPVQSVLYVGRDPMSMETELRGQDLEFRYRLTNARELSGERLLASESVGDNILAILTELRGSKKTVQRILRAVGDLGGRDREVALEVLFLLSGLRELEETVEREARKMPVFDDILANKVLGREFKRGLQQGLEEGLEKGLEQGLEQGLEKGLEQGRQGQVKMLLRLLAKRYGRIPPSFRARLSKLSSSELDRLVDRIDAARTIDEILT